jgi:hypothetical protein
LAEGTRVPGENHRLVTSHWQTWLYNAASRIILNGWTDTDYRYMYKQTNNNTIILNHSIILCENNDDNNKDQQISVDTKNKLSAFSIAFIVPRQSW